MAPGPESNTAESDLTKSLSRALTIIDAIAEAGRPQGVTEIARKVNVHKSSVYRLLRTMVEFGYLEQHEATSAYWLGPQLSRLGQTASLHLELPKLARIHVDRLAKHTRETVNLVKLRGDVCVYLLSIQTDQSIGMIALPVGATDALHCTAAGKAMLAYLPRRRAEALIERLPLTPRTSATLRTPAALLAQLETIHARGYAVDDRENDENVRCIGSAVFNRHGEVIGAISVSAPDFRLTNETIASVAPRVIACAADVSAAIGLPRSENPLLQVIGSSGVAEP